MRKKQVKILLFSSLKNVKCTMIIELLLLNKNMFWSIENAVNEYKAGLGSSTTQVDRAFRMWDGALVH